MAGTTHPVVPATPCYAEPNVLGGSQSIDNLQSSQSLTAQEHLRLRGGTGTAAGQKKSDGSRKKRLKSTSTDETPAESRMNVNPSGEPPNKAQKSETSSALPCHFAVKDRIEVSASGHGTSACIPMHVKARRLKMRCDAHYKNQFQQTDDSEDTILAERLLHICQPQVCVQHEAVLMSITI